MAESLEPAHPFLLVHFKGSFEKVKSLVADAVGIARYTFPLLFLNKFVGPLVVLKRGVVSIVVDHEEKDDAQGPNICLNPSQFTLNPYGYLFSTSGAMVARVPRAVWLPISSSRDICLEKPRSATFKTPLWMRMFASLRSLWTIPFLCIS